MEQTIEEKLIETARWENDLYALVRKCKANWMVNFDNEVKDVVNALYKAEEVIGKYRNELNRKL